jgi:hypothetical protein
MWKNGAGVSFVVSGELLTTLGPPVAWKVIPTCCVSNRLIATVGGDLVRMAKPHTLAHTRWCLEGYSEGEES